MINGMSPPQSHPFNIIDVNVHRVTIKGCNNRHILSLQTEGQMSYRPNGRPNADRPPGVGMTASMDSIMQRVIDGLLSIQTLWNLAFLW